MNNKIDHIQKFLPIWVWLIVSVQICFGYLFRGGNGDESGRFHTWGVSVGLCDATPMLLGT